jgi:hypothetical protein
VDKLRESHGLRRRRRLYHHQRNKTDEDCKIKTSLMDLCDYVPHLFGSIESSITLLSTQVQLPIANAKPVQNAQTKRT